MGRAVTPLADVDPGAILSLMREAFAYMDGRIDPPSSLHRLTVDAVRQHIRKSELWGILAPQPIACMVLTQQSDRLYLGKVAVHHVYRGRGFARDLVVAAQARARELGLSLLELESRIELTEVHTAFERLGFRKTGTTAHPGYTRPTSATMQCEVHL